MHFKKVVNKEPRDIVTIGVFENVDILCRHITFSNDKSFVMCIGIFGYVNNDDSVSG